MGHPRASVSPLTREEGHPVASPSGAVDAHVHLWDLERMHLSWFRQGLGLPSVVAPGQLEAAATHAETPVGSVRSAIAVQAGDTAGELAWLTALRHPLLAGVVRQYDPAEASSPADARLASRASGLLRGARVAVPSRRADLTDVPGLDELSERSAAEGDVVEFLVRPEQLPAVAALAARHPGTSYVVCHLGLGAADPDAAWAESLRLVAARSNVHGKVSGLVVRPTGRTGDDGPDAAHARLRHCLAVAVDAFGGHRLLFGSDWPMSARVAPYDRIVDRLARALPALDDVDTAALWGGTARELYRL